MAIKQWVITFSNKKFLIVGNKKPTIKEYKVPKQKPFTYIVYDEATNIDLTK